MSDQKLKHYELLPQQQQHSWKCTLDSTYILYTRSPLPHSISQEYISLILFRQSTSRGQSLEMWRERYYLEALWLPSSDPSPDGWGRARPCCWPCKSKRTHRTEQTVSDETTTFFAALLHTYNYYYIRRCRTSSSILWCTQAAVGESVLTRNVVILIYVDSITITPVSEHSELEIIKKMVKCLFCCAAAAAHSVWVSDLKYFCWWKNSILCIYVLKIRKPSSTISNFWHTVLMLVSSQSVLLLLFVYTTKTVFWKM